MFWSPDQDLIQCFFFWGRRKEERDLPYLLLAFCLACSVAFVCHCRTGLCVQRFCGQRRLVVRDCVPLDSVDVLCPHCFGLSWMVFFLCRRKIRMNPSSVLDGVASCRIVLLPVAFVASFLALCLLLFACFAISLRLLLILFCLLQFVVCCIALLLVALFAH